MPKRYSEVEIEKALIAAATLGIRPSARELGIDHRTIWQWTQDRAEQYARIKAEEAPKWRARAAAGYEDIADRLSQAEHKALDRLEAQMDKVEGKDLARTVKDLATAKGINTQHINSLRGQPAQVVEHKVNLTLVQRAIAELESVESSAVEDESPSLPPAA